MGKKIAHSLFVVIDTNVLISCLLFSGRLEPLRTLWQTGRVVPLLSKQTFDKLHRVLAYPKFRLAPQEITAIIQLEILPYFEVLESVPQVPATCRDENDDKFLAVALGSNAAYLITGDQDLLVLAQFQETRIVTPADFLASHIKA
jgi:putative PIN family toxin of toxin-antitoxin system